MADLHYGIRRLSPSKRKTALESRLQVIADELCRAEWTDAVSEAFGEIKTYLETRGNRIEHIDVAIAAHAKALGAVLVTAYRAHMPRVPGLKVEDWCRNQ